MTFELFETRTAGATIKKYTYTHMHAQRNSTDINLAQYHH